MYSHLKSVPFFCLLLVLASLIFTSTHAITIEVKNNCQNTVWAAAVPGGGKEMSPGSTWPVTANPGQNKARIWARTGCKSTGPNGLQCTTGDCGGLLQCTAYGTPPNTLAEYSLKQYQNLDFFDISLIDGFNVPMSFLPISNGCSKGPTCTADVIGQCPSELKTNEGCNNPCTVYKSDMYCCNSGSCGPTPLSKFFKNLCPDAYSYPKDDATSLYTCATGTNYRVTFCP